MPHILNGELFQEFMSQGYTTYKNYWNLPNLEEVDANFQTHLFKNDEDDEPVGIKKKQKGRRGINDWRTSKDDGRQIDDWKFYAILFLILATGNTTLKWLQNLLQTTSVPIYTPLSPNLLRAYLEQARFAGEEPTSKDINSIVDMYFETKVNLRVIAVTGTQILSPLHTLTPLETESRYFIRAADEINISGLSLYRYIPTFADTLADMLKRGLKLKILLLPKEGQAIHMVTMRSWSKRSLEQQRDLHTHAVQEIERLQSISSNVELRYLDYMPSVGITIYRHAANKQQSLCQIRLIPFGEKTSDAPSFLLSPNSDNKWFSYFSNQFQLMWDSPDAIKHIFK